MSESKPQENETERVPEEVQTNRPFGQMPVGSREVPLFLRDISDGRKGNAQDEKDEMAE